MNEVARVKAWLTGTRHITVPGDWLEACLEWLKEEHQVALSSDQLMGMVYDQWLAADLRELQTSCLPRSVTEDDKTFIQGFFCLQVDSLLDVSQPYYGQLQKVKGTENANVHVTATQPTQPANDMKAGRMLMLKMTDGTVDVQGMEYRPIPALRLHLQPGCKVCIKGRVLCRRGVLFLKSENFEILGGEVDSFLETNTQEKLLESALAGGSDQAPRQEYRQQFENTEITRKSNPQSDGPSRSIRPGQSGTSTGTTFSKGHKQPVNTLKKDTFSSKVEDRRPPSHVNPGNKKNDSFPDFEMDDDDDFLKSLATTELAALEQEWDEEMDDVMDSGIDQTGRPSTERVRSTGQPGQNINNAHRNAAIVSKQSSQNSRTAVVAGQPRSQPMATVRPHATTVRPQAATVRPRAATHSEIRPRVGQITRTSTSTCSRPSQLGTASARLNSGQSSRSAYQGHPRTNAGNQTTGNDETDNLAELMADDDFPMDDDDFPMDDDFEEPSFSFPPLSKRLKPSETLTGVQSTSLNIQTTTVTVQHDQSEVCVKITHTPDKQIPGGSLGNTQTENDFGQRRHANTSSSVTNMRVGRSQSPKTGLTECSQLLKFKHPDDLINHIRRTTQTTRRYGNTDIDEDKPYTYLSRVEPVLKAKKHVVFTVKAYVATLLSKLDNGQGQGWRLMCRLNDGSSTMDVDLADQVLTELIGYSAQESLVMKEKAKDDQSVMEPLAEGIKECQLKLINMSCLFKVEFHPSYPRPCVVQIIPVTNAQIEELYARVAKKLCP